GGSLLDDHVTATNVSHVVDDTCGGSSMADDPVHAIAEDKLSEKNEKVQAGWVDPKVHAMKNSFVNVVLSEIPKAKVNFRTLVNKKHVEDSDFVLPLDIIMAIQHRYENSLVGYFVGKSVAFPCIQNYVSNTWSINWYSMKIFEDYCSDNQYAISIKEDMAYMCLHLLKTIKETRSNTSYLGMTNTPYLSHMEIKYSGRYQTWSLLQETPDTPYPRP
ncbi:hypothetical protein Tco_1117263, partial [Tanacetum coccineum]